MTVHPPPSLRCRRLTGVEDDENTGSSLRWFVCRLLRPLLVRRSEEGTLAPLPFLQRIHARLRGTGLPSKSGHPLATSARTRRHVFVVGLPSRLVNFWPRTCHAPPFSTATEPVRS
jgi:hypothetical protein